MLRMEDMFMIEKDRIWTVVVRDAFQEHGLPLSIVKPISEENDKIVFPIFTDIDGAGTFIEREYPDRI